MNDLINREDALHAIGAEIVGVTNEGRQLLEMCQFVIKQLPSIEHKKGDWICTNCKNLNYSFRTVCNRCKYPKFFLLVNNPITHRNELNINNSNYNCPVYCFSPSIIVFNNIPNVFIK